ncbi:hypothetical protein CYMTET_40939 [Cymbomonas tetramitiformis]|uniref:Uncharacterized protein n=1 Tax=Cymbomonas tetramitiformis TaxID=36881 RepID=A0AAE0C875_9CHLO|nr:hypothetical protein CYMTET_40939 [Cymbomonas tetramitiformis]
MNGLSTNSATAAITGSTVAQVTGDVAATIGQNATTVNNTINNTNAALNAVKTAAVQSAKISNFTLAASALGVVTVGVGAATIGVLRVKLADKNAALDQLQQAYDQINKLNKSLSSNLDTQTGLTRALQTKLDRMANWHLPAMHRANGPTMRDTVRVHLTVTPRYMLTDADGRITETWLDLGPARRGKELKCDTDSDLEQCVKTFVNQLYQSPELATDPPRDFTSWDTSVLIAQKPRYAVLLSPIAGKISKSTWKPGDNFELLPVAMKTGGMPAWMRAAIEPWGASYPINECKRLSSDSTTALRQLFIK